MKFEDVAPRPQTIERNAKKAEELNRIYQTDMLMRRMMNAIYADDHEAVRKLVFAGADLEWRDEKGRTIVEFAKDMKRMACLKVIDTCKIRLQQARVEANLKSSKAKPVVLPRIALAVPPRTHHGKRRHPLKVVTYREHVVTAEDKYKLKDRNEYVTESEESESSEEELVNFEERLRVNTMRYMSAFYPPLIPTGQKKEKSTTIAQVDSGLLKRAPSSNIEQVPSAGIERVSSAANDANAVDGNDGEPSDNQAEPGIERVSSCRAQESALATAGEEDSGSTFLTSMSDSRGAMPTTASTKQMREREVFAKKEEGRTQRKRELFLILQSGPMKGGIDDLATTSKEHKYLRECQNLAIMPRPLVFGQSDPEHINLSGFGLHEKNGKALELALNGLDNCKSISFSQNRLGKEGIKAVCKALRNNPPLLTPPLLTSLDLSFCDMRNNVDDLVCV